MSACCTTTSNEKPKNVKQDCPGCGHTSLIVSTKTVLHHIKQPWMLEHAACMFFFCRNPNCDTVYFSNTSFIMKTSDVRTPVGIKTRSGDAIICYCFGVNQTDANQLTKDFVIAQTKKSNCSCETANPSGRCCLKDFPRF